MASTNISTHLPPEIIGTIAARLYDDFDSTYDVQQCALVSRAFRDHFQPWLFNSIQLCDTPRNTERLASKDVRQMELLFESISRRPELARHVKRVGVVLGFECQNETVPKLLELLPSVEGFVLYASRPTPTWIQFTSAMKAAITTVTRLPSLRILRIFGFPTIPPTLLRANGRLDELFINNGDLPSAEEHQRNSVEQPATAIPSTYFTSVRRLMSVHSPVLGAQEWLLAAIKGASVSGSLRSLSIVPVFFKPPGMVTSGTSSTLFGEPFDLRGASSLVNLRLMCFDGSPQWDGTAELFFEAFCQFVHGTVATVEKGLALEELELHYISRKDHQPLLEAPFWDLPAWKELSSLVCDVKSRESQKRCFEVSLTFTLYCIPEEDPALACSIIQGFVRQSAPGIKCFVSFGATPPANDTWY